MARRAKGLKYVTTQLLKAHGLLEEFESEEKFNATFRLIGFPPLMIEKVNGLTTVAGELMGERYDSVTVTREWIPVSCRRGGRRVVVARSDEGGNIVVEDTTEFGALLREIARLAFNIEMQRWGDSQLVGRT